MGNGVVWSRLMVFQAWPCRLDECQCAAPARVECPIDADEPGLMGIKHHQRWQAKMRPHSEEERNVPALEVRTLDEASADAVMIAWTPTRPRPSRCGPAGAIHTPFRLAFAASWRHRGVSRASACRVAVAQSRGEGVLVALQVAHGSAGLLLSDLADMLEWLKRNEVYAEASAAASVLAAVDGLLTHAVRREGRLAGGGRIRRFVPAASDARLPG